MKLFLVRHGQSEGNLKSCYTGQTDIPLTDIGRQQAMSIRPLLEKYSFDKVYSSDLSRAFETCTLAIPDADVEKLKLLREFDVGRLAGIQLGSVPRKVSDDLSQRPDYTDYDGENAAMVRARAKAFLEMLEDKPYEYVAAFSHFGFINCILRTVLGTTYESKLISTGNCAIHVIEYDGSVWRILAINYGMVV